MHLVRFVILTAKEHRLMQSTAPTVDEYLETVPP